MALIQLPSSFGTPDGEWIDPKEVVAITTGECAEGYVIYVGLKTGQTIRITFGTFEDAQITRDHIASVVNKDSEISVSTIRKK